MKVSGVGAQAGLTSANKNSIEDRMKKDLHVSHSSVTQSDFSQFHKAQSASLKLNAMQRKHTPAAVLTFGGTKNKNQQVFVGAELDPYCKVGGVGSVMKDYSHFKQPRIIPYYNANIKYDPKTGQPTKDISVYHYDPATKKPVPAGQAGAVPFYTKADLDKVTIEKVVTDGDFVELEHVASKSMQWGMEDNVPIALYKVKKTKDDHGLNDFMVFVDSTAQMPKPYADGSYSFGNVEKKFEGEKDLWKGDAYAKFSKATTELLPEIKTIKEQVGDKIEDVKFNPETVVCSDQQTAYIPHYMAQKAIKDDAYYKDVKPTFVEHNMGEGYRGETSKRNMFVNLAETSEQVKQASQDPDYIEKMRLGQSEDYFENIVKDALVVTKPAESNNKAVTQAMANAIPLLYAKEGYVTHVSTVAEEYAKAVYSKPQVSPGLTNLHKELFDAGKYSGILNPMADPNHDPYKPMPGFLTHFQEHRVVTGEELKRLQDEDAALPAEKKKLIAEEKNGKTIFKVKNDHPPLEVFKKDCTLAEMREVKKKAKINLFRRAAKENIVGDKRYNLLGRKDTSIIHGHIDEKWVQKLEKGEDVKLFVGWGRGDFQKGLDIVMASFEKFGQTLEGKNSVLMVGGALDPKNSESSRVKKYIDKLLNNPEFSGRVVYVDGFAPGAAMATAADAAVFPSRFAPCELTDLEAKKHFATPIVTGTQGLDQKNFDPRKESEKEAATSYKTEHEFMMSHDDLEKASPEFKAEYQKMHAAEVTKLQNRGVEAELITNMAHTGVKSTEDYALLARESADNVIIDEIAKAMSAKATETDDIADKILKNHQAEDTSWTGNAKLHPKDAKGIQHSSAALYQERHFTPEPVKPTKTLFDGSKIKQAVVGATSMVGNATGTHTPGTPANAPQSPSASGAPKSGESASDAAKDAGKGFMDMIKENKGKTALIAGAVGLVAGLGFYAMRKPSQAVASNADGDTFKSQATVKKSNNPQITGASNKRNWEKTEIA